MAPSKPAPDPADAVRSAVAAALHRWRSRAGGLTQVRVALSGGRDSAALAVLMRETRPDLDIEYFFTDTGKELKEVYEFLGRLEGFLGREIVRLNPDRDFDFWLREYNNFLPSPRTRWER